VIHSDETYLSAQERTFEEMTLEERQSLYRKIGYEIVLEISKVFRRDALCPDFGWPPQP